MLSYYGVIADWEASLQASTDERWNEKERAALAKIYKSHQSGNRPNDNDDYRRYQIGRVKFLFHDAAEGINIGVC